MSDANEQAAFLDGRGIAVDLKDIEAELEALWGPAAEQAGGPDLEHPAVTKLVLANVVLARLSPHAGDAGPDDLSDVLDAVASRYPARTIVLCRDGGRERRLRAEVSALCHLPAPGQPQVCSERIVLRVGHDALGLIPGAVRPLLESDIPRILWWADDPGQAPDLYRDLAGEATRILLDRPDPQADPAFLREAVEASSVLARDLSWYGAAPWRERIAGLFDPPDTRPALRRITRIAIEARAAEAERPPRVAVWLAAWLAGQLGWRPDRVEPLGPAGLDAHFLGPDGTVLTSIRTEPAPGASTASIASVHLGIREPEGEGTFHLSRPAGSPDEVRIETSSATHCRLPRHVRAPELDRAHRVASALEARHDDPPYRRALPHALWMLGLTGTTGRWSASFGP